MSDGVAFDPGYGPLVDTTVRIATWNVWARYGPWERRAPVIASVLRALDADIVALQEAWQADETTQARELARELGFTGGVFAPNLMFPDGTKAGNAVISRWPITRQDVCTLPRQSGIQKDDEGEERLCVFAEVDGPRGTIQVFCAHLSWRDDHSAVRQEQVRAICEFVRSKRPRAFPAVLVGDLNAEPVSDEIRALTGRTTVPVPGVVFHDAWEVAGDGGRGLTVQNRNPFAGALLGLETRIDYVLVGQPKLGGVGHPRRTWVYGDEPVDGVYGSDHFGVAADLRY